MSTAPDYTWNHHKSFNTNLSLRTLCVNPNQWGTYLAGVTIYCYKSSNIIVKYRASELFSCFKKVAIWLIPWINNIFNHLVNNFFKLIYLEEFDKANAQFILDWMMIPALWVSSQHIITNNIKPTNIVRRETCVQFLHL